MSSGYLDTIDRYVYRSPAWQLAVSTLASAGTGPPPDPVPTSDSASMALDDGVMEHASHQ
jgi:hypothetical protein